MEFHRLVPGEYVGDLANGKKFRLHRRGRKWQLTTWDPCQAPGPDDVADQWPSFQAACDELLANEGGASFDEDHAQDWLPVDVGADGSDCSRCALQPVTGILSHNLRGKLTMPVRPCPDCARYTYPGAAAAYNAWDKQMGGK